VGTAAGLYRNQARLFIGKVLQHLGAFDLHVDDLACAHVHAVQLKHVLGYVQSDDLFAIHGADDLSCVHSCITIHGGSSMVLVKTLVYHTLGTLMPYPSEDPPRLLKASLPDRRLFMPLAFSGLNSVARGQGGIHSISYWG